MSAIGMSLFPPTPLSTRARSPGVLNDTDAMKISRSWLVSDAWGLLMLGAVGRGKSQAAAWLWHKLSEQDMAEAIDRSAPTRGVPWLRARVLQRLRWDERADVLRACAGAYGVVVDEMGAENAYTAHAISDLIEERGDRGDRTIMTTNLDPKGFLDRYGDRLTSRLRSGGVDNGHARWAKVVRGDDLRGLDIPQRASTDPDEAPPEPVTPERQQEILAKYGPRLVEGTP